MADIPPVKIKIQAEETLSPTIDKLKSKLTTFGQSASAMSKSIAGLFAGIAIGAKIKAIEDTNEQILLLSQRTGTSTKFISSLNQAARTAGVQFGDLAGLIQEIPKAIAEANSGESSKIEAFARLNLDYKALKAMPIEQAVTTIMTQIGRLNSTPSMLKGVADLLGDSGTNMISLFQNISKNGIQYFENQAVQTGLVVDDKTAQMAQQFNTSFRIIGTVVDGAVTKLMAELAPAVAVVAKDLTDFANNGGTNMDGLGDKTQKFGSKFLSVMKAVTSGISLVASGWKGLVDSFTYDLGTMSQLDWGLLKSPFETSWHYYKDSAGKTQREMITNFQKFKMQYSELNNMNWDNLKNNAKNAAQNMDDLINSINGPSAPQQTSNAGGGRGFVNPTPGQIILPGQASAGANIPVPGAPLPTGTIPGVTKPGNNATDINPNALANAVALQQAKLAYITQANAKELQMLQIHNAMVQKENDDAFSQGLISAQQYYDKKVQMLKDENQSEIDSLNDQIKKQQDVLKSQQAQAGLDPNAQVAVEQTKLTIKLLQKDVETKNLDLASKILDVEVERRQKLRESNDELRAFTAEQANQIGNQIPQMQLDLDEKIKKLKQILTLQGKNTDEINKQVDAVQKQGQANIDLQKSKDAMQQSMDSYDLAKQGIEVYQSGGVFQQITGEQQLLDLQKQRVDVLMQLAQAQLAAAQASNNPAEIQASQQQILAIQQIKINVDKANNSFQQLSDTAINSLQNNLGTFFESAIGSSKNFKDAFKQLTLSVVDDLRKQASQMLANLAVQQMLQAVKGFMGAGAATGGLITDGRPGYAVGGVVGMVYGQGTGTSDSIPVNLSNREFVVRNKAVETPGAIDFLHNFNQYGMPYVEGLMQKKGFADGGIVGTADFSKSSNDSSSSKTDVAIGLESGLVVKHLKTTEGTRAIAEVISSNKKMFKNLLS